MEIIVKGRNAEVSDRFRKHVGDKLRKIEQFAPRAQRVDVEVTHEPNPSQAETSERIEITVVDKGPVIRAEAAASDRYGAIWLLPNSSNVSDARAIAVRTTGAPSPCASRST